jgi:hypothetical protein
MATRIAISPEFLNAVEWGRAEMPAHAQRLLLDEFRSRLVRPPLLIPSYTFMYLHIDVARYCDTYCCHETRTWGMKVPIVLPILGWGMKLRELSFGFPDVTAISMSQVSG